MSFCIRVAHKLSLDSQKVKLEDLERSLHQALPPGELELLHPASGPHARLIVRRSLDTGLLFHFILGLASAFFPGRIGASYL